MSNGLNVFNVAPGTAYPLEHIKSVVERALDQKLIKEREQGGTKLSYIGGHTVIRLLNEAFGYGWSFEIVRDEIVESQPKAATEWNQQTKRRAPVMNADGTPKMEPQPPVVKVLGRLTVPGYGVKEQYGSKVLIGGASEQESTFKSASTDALKKCATMFGIGLELYDDEEVDQAQKSSAPAPAKPAYQNTYQSKPATPAPASGKYDPNDITKIKELKDKLAVTTNAQLDPFAREFLQSPEATFKMITPTNIKAFNMFLSKKVELS